MELNNPAARLHHILSLCKKYHKECADRPMFVGWRKVFRMMDSVPDFAVLERVGRVLGLLPQTVELVSRHPELPPQLYLGWVEELEESFLEIHAASTFEKFASRLPKTLMVNLEFCANALAERCPERVVPDEAVAELNKQLQELHRAARAEELDAASRRYLLDGLALLRCALEDYSLRGSAGLQKAVDAATGALVSQRNVAIPMRETPLGKRYWEVLNKFTSALADPEAGKAKDGGASGPGGARRGRLHVSLNTRNGQPLPKTAKLLQL